MLGGSLTDKLASTLGGFLMAAVGVLYLVFEQRILSGTDSAGNTIASANNALSRSLIGAQVSKRRAYIYLSSLSNRI